MTLPMYRLSPLVRPLALGLALVAALPAHAERPASDTVLSNARIDRVLKNAYDKYKGLREGKNADSIPALAKVPSELFGITLITADGRIHSAGSVDQLFSIQSISKVITMAAVFQESGEKVVQESLGVEATGDVLDSIVAIERHKGQELNPMVNAGAITTTALVKGASSAEVWGRILDFHEAFAGRKLEVNQDVYKSQSDTNERDQAMAMLMHAYDRLPGDPQRATDLYTRQCSINVNARDLANVAATLANGGVNPVNGKRVFDQKHVKSILAVMASAGLGDGSGKWLFMTGLPAKSGIGGGMIAVSPGRFGIAAFSPRLDAAGNSVRAQKAIADISAALEGNPYDARPDSEIKQPGGQAAPR